MGESQQAPASIPEPEKTLSEIEELGTAVSAKLKPWSRPDWAHIFDTVEKKASEYVDSIISSSVGPDAVTDAPPRPPAADFIEVIKDRREKLALTSSTTDQIVGICKQILAFGVAGLALSVGFSDKIHSFSVSVQKLIVLAGVFYVELVLLSLVVLIWYLLQAHFRYPFLYLNKIGNAWPYFYYSSISRTVNRSPIQTARTRVEAGKSFAKDFVKFSEGCLKETPKQRLRAELQQYFLLVSYQGYVQQFALRLANIFFYGFFGAAVSTALIGIWSAAK
jgi:hypothetical protein